MYDDSEPNCVYHQEGFTKSIFIMPNTEEIVSYRIVCDLMLITSQSLTFPGNTQCEGCSDYISCSSTLATKQNMQ